MVSAADVFEKFTIFGKGGLVLFLLILAYLNAHTEYVEKNPRKFIIDAIATAGFGAIAAMWLTWTRGRTDLLLNHFVFALMLFFLYAVCREFAGYFTVFGSEKMTNMEKKEQSVLKWPVTALFFVGLVTAIGLAIAAKVPPDFSDGGLARFAKDGWRGAFAFETLIFAAIISMGEVVVAKNHDDSGVKAGLESMFMFVAISCVLQAGGFYQHLYSSTPPCIQ
jgi:hypothetical protein